MIPFDYEMDRSESVSNAGPSPAPPDDPFRHFEDEDVREWAGTTTFSRGLSYQGQGRVEKLARTPDGGLVAWVRGTERYATLVQVVDNNLTSTCTCPVGFSCKHAVAVVLEYLGFLQEGEEVPVSDPNDRRLLLLEDDSAEAWDEDEYDEYDEEDDAEDASSRPAPRAVARGGSRSGAVRSFLEGHTKAQLVELIEGLAASQPAVRQALQDRVELASGATGQLVRTIQRELAKSEAGPSWRDDEPDLANYVRIRQRLDALLEQGHADEVVALGKEILATGARDVEMSEEGEIAEDVIPCIEVIYRSLPRSSLTPVEQMLWAIDAELADEYDLTQGDEVAAFWELERTPGEWSIVADTLLRRLDERRPASGGERSYSDYKRDRLADWAIMALEGAGRDDEVIPLCEREAVATSSYARLVDRLIEAGRHAEAEDWIGRGVVATQERLPGIATQLRGKLRDLREQRGDWPTVAALRADDFFREPGPGTYHALREASERADLWPVVRAAALRFLETGQRPGSATKDEAGAPTADWPLPHPGIEEPESPRYQVTSFPLTDALIQIALDEGRLDDALGWYDRHRPDPYGWAWSGSLEDKLADAVADSHPERAVAMWKARAEKLIAQTNVGAYESAAVYLRKARDRLHKLGREDEWTEYLAALRLTNKRKWRLVEILDSLTRRPIVEGGRA